MKQEVWPSGSGELRPTQYASGRLWWHRYSILFPQLRRSRDETYRRCKVVTLTFDLKTGVQCSTCRGVPFCQFWWYYDYSLSIYELLGVGARQWAGRDVIAIEWSASSNLCRLDGGNWQITVFRRQNSRFRKRFSKIRLSYNVAVPH